MRLPRYTRSRSALIDSNILIDLSVENVEHKRMPDGSVEFTREAFHNLLTLEPGLRSKSLLWLRPDGKKVWAEIHAYVGP